MTDTYAITRETIGPDHNGTIGTNVYVGGMHVGSYTGQGQWSQEVEKKAALFQKASELAEFVQLIANMNHDGEEMSDGTEFYMTQEDAFMTVENLIASARQIMGNK